MRIKRNTWIIFFVLSLVSLSVWYKFSYPRLSFVDLSVNRSQALQLAKNYLREEREIDPSKYKTAIVFEIEGETDRYLQKTLGFEKLKTFIHEHDFDMFFWLIRFFKENEKEEYRLSVSSATGQITGLTHIIDANEARKEIDREEAKRIAKQFLRDQFHFNPDNYTLNVDLKKGYDHRSDFSFAWQRKDVNIPWSEDENQGTGKLLIGATISGTEVLSFFENSFSVPEQFHRDLAKQAETGQNISIFVRILFLFLFVSSIYFVVARRNHLAMHCTKKFYLGIMFLAFLLTILSSLNELQATFFNYSTTSKFYPYLLRFAVNVVVDVLFATVAIIMPGLAGELLRFETFKEKKEASFLYYLHSTFLSRSVVKSILLGYCACVIMLGIQALLVHFGQMKLGVWTQHSWMVDLSTAYLPFLAAFSLGFKAAFYEEIMFRLFAISWGKKLFKSSLIAVIISSLVWGFAHSTYPVFPMWFRGVEVTCLGFFLAFIYLRFGIIPVIVAHYLFDVFWATAEFLFGTTKPFFFYSSLFVLLIPLAWAVLAFVINKNIQEKSLRWHLNKHQKFNLEILKIFLQKNPDRFLNLSKEELKKEIASHGWDVAVVEVALEDLDTGFLKNTNTSAE